MDSTYLVHADSGYDEAHVTTTMLRDIVGLYALYTALNQSSMQHISMQFDTGEFLEHILAYILDIFRFLWFLHQQLKVFENTTYSTHILPNEKYVIILTFHTTLHKLVCQYKSTTLEKCLPLSRLILVSELTKETSSVRKRPPSDELNQ